MSDVTTLLRKECVENLSVFRTIVMFIFVCILMSVYSILLISNTEMSLLDNAHAEYMLTELVLTLSLLVTLLLGSDGIAGERERDTLEVLLLSPVNGRSISVSKLFNILFTWLILFVLSLPYLWAIAGNGQNLVPSISNGNSLCNNLWRDFPDIIYEVSNSKRGYFHRYDGLSVISESRNPRTIFKE